MSKKVETIAAMLQLIAKSQKKSQVEVAELAEINPQQVNRFFNGHSDMHLSYFVKLLEALEIDLEEIIREKAQQSTKLDEPKLNNAVDCLVFMYKNLDKIGQQTYLQNLTWASKVSSKKKLPLRVEEIVKAELNMV